MTGQLFYFCLSCLIGISASLASAADMQVADKSLQVCIDKLAKKNKWQSAADVKTIQCHSSGITSLEGINKFTNVKKLSFHKNEITSVDLQGLNLLEHLNLARNNLTTLKLSSLPALEEVFAFSNKLTSFELDNLPKLKQIKANSNQLTQFSYKALPELEKIYLFDNLMEMIDIYNLPSMRYMDVRQNPMPDELYEKMDALSGVTILHDGNAEDWQ